MWGGGLGEERESGGGRRGERGGGRRGSGGIGEGGRGKRGGREGRKKFNFLLCLRGCHDNELINWCLPQIPPLGLVAMATNGMLSSDWSKGLVHNMNNICIRRTIVLRQKNHIKHFICSFKKYKSFTLKKAKFRTNSNCSSLQDGQVTISWVRVAKRTASYRDRIQKIKTSFNDIIRTAINHDTYKKPTNLKLSFR